MTEVSRLLASPRDDTVCGTDIGPCYKLRTAPISVDMMTTYGRHVRV